MPATYSNKPRSFKPTYKKVYGKSARWACGTQRNPWQHNSYPRMPQTSEEDEMHRWNLVFGTPEEKEAARKWLEENRDA